MKTLFTFLFLITILGIHAQNFVLDSTFADDGIAKFEDPQNEDIAFKGFQAGNGSYIILKISLDNDFYIGKLNVINILEDGKLNPDFGIDGKIQFDYIYEDIIPSFVQLPDNLFAIFDLGIQNAINIKIFNEDGVLQQSISSVPIEGDYYFFPSSIIYKDGYFVLGFEYASYEYFFENESTDSSAIVKIDMDGLVDTTFANSGIIKFKTEEYSSSVSDIQLTSSGFVAGVVYNPNDYDQHEPFNTIYKFTLDGKLNQNFGENGALNLSEIHYFYYLFLNVDSSDNIYFASEYDPFCIKIDSVGDFVMNYGIGGVAIDFTNGDYYYETLFSVENKGEIYLFGDEYDYTIEESFPVVLKYNKDGEADDSFGENGVLKLEDQVGIFFNGLLDSSNRLFLMGSTDYIDDGPSDLIFARFKENSSSSHDILLQDNNFIIYPNPNTGESVFIAFNDDIKGDINIELFDINGKYVKHLFTGNANDANGHEIALPEDLKQGIYMLRMSTGDGVAIKKLNVIN